MQKFKLNREEILKRFRYILNDADYAKVSNGLPPIVEVEGELLEGGMVEKVKLPEMLEFNKNIPDIYHLLDVKSKINEILTYLASKENK